MIIYVDRSFRKLTTEHTWYRVPLSSASSLAQFVGQRASTGECTTTTVLLLHYYCTTFPLSHLLVWYFSRPSLSSSDLSLELSRSLDPSRSPVLVSITLSLSISLSLLISLLPIALLILFFWCLSIFLLNWFDLFPFPLSCRSVSLNISLNHLFLLPIDFLNCFDLDTWGRTKLQTHLGNDREELYFQVGMSGNERTLGS